MRREALQSIRLLQEEKKRVKLQMNALIAKKKQEETAAAPAGQLGHHIGTIAGWILAFYLTSYIVSYPFTMKIFGGFVPPHSFYFYDSIILKGVTIFLFLMFGAITIRNYWAPRGWFGTLVLVPLAGVSFLLIAVNLM